MIIKKIARQPVIFIIAAIIPLIIACNQQPEKPNILFIMSDDHAFQAISAYGTGLNKTPNIDRIAEEGAIFTHGYVTNSICAPCRAVVLTGKHSFVNGKIDNRGDFNWDQPNFAKLLQQNGYQTALFGKIHLNGLPQGFDYSLVLQGQGRYYNPVFFQDGEKMIREGYTTELITEAVMDWLKNKRNPEQPFCLLYQQKAPHRNWMPAPKYLSLFNDTTFTPPDNYFDNYEGRGTAAKEQKMEVDGHATWGPDFKLERDPSGNPTNFGFINQMNDEQQAIWKAAYDPVNEAFLEAGLEGEELAIWKYNRYIKDYLRTIRSIDDGVGEVLDYLDETGLAENTIVIYTSDQGFYLGEHGWFDKRFMYEESFRTPLLMRYPQEIKPGTVVDALVQNLDYAPTFLDYAGVEIPGDMQGESFRDIASGKSDEWRDAIYYTYYEYPGPHSVKRHYGVRTDRYKIIHFYYDVDEWELYDLERDPSEMQSVYEDPEYAEVREMMHRKLEELRAYYGDSNENNHKILQTYLDQMEKNK